jgi:hypothetical protein
MELYNSKGIIIDVIPIIFHDRYIGKFKLSRKDIINFFFIALKLRISLI